MISKSLKVLSIVLYVIAFSLILIGHGTNWYFHGFSAVQEALSPFNLGNMICTLAVLAPGFAAQKLSERLT